MLGGLGQGEKIRRTGNHHPGVAGTGAEHCGFPQLLGLDAKTTYNGAEKIESAEEPTDSNGKCLG